MKKPYTVIVFIATTATIIYFTAKEKINGLNSINESSIMENTSEAFNIKKHFPTIRPTHKGFTTPYTGEAAITANLKLRTLINNFPFPQNQIKPILGANTPEIRKALQKFNQEVLEEIINNPNLTKEDQNKILWNIFIDFDWQEHNNALQSIIQDHLASNSPFQIANELHSTYQKLSASNGDYELMHNLLQISDSILKIDPISADSQNTEQLNNSIATVRYLLLEQIRGTSQSSESANLTSFSIDLYYSNSSPNEAAGVLATITSTAELHPEVSLQLYHSAWKNILSNPNSSLQSTNIMLASSSQQSSQALTFLLKEDGNIAISDIPQTTRAVLLTYLKSLQNQSASIPDLEISIHRLIKENKF